MNDRLCAYAGCQRAALDDSSCCEAHLRSVLAAAFGGPAEPVRRVERLSESDPFCVAVAEEKRGARAA